MRTLIVFFAIFSSSLSFASLRPSEILLDAYSPLCPEETAAVQGSLQNIALLRGVIEQFRSEDQCYGANGLNSVLAGYDSLYQNYLVYQNNRIDRLTLQKKVAALTTLLETPSLTATEVDFIRTEIMSAQSELISYESENSSRFGKLSSRWAVGAGQLVNSVDSFLGSWSQNPACFQKRASLVSSLLSNTLLATSAFSSPGTSLALASGAMVVESFQKLINNLKYNDDLSDLDFIQFPLAVRCVSNALSKQYCESRETQEVINYFREDRDRDEQSLQGINLLKNNLFQLDRWLQEVYAGSEISSEGDLVNREKPILQAELLKRIKRNIQAFKAVRFKDLRDITDPKKRSDAIATGIESLVCILYSPTLRPSLPRRDCGIHSSSEVENPIFISRDMTLLQYQLFDPALTEVPECTVGGEVKKCSGLLDYINELEVILDLQQWDRSVAESINVLEEVLDIVNETRARTVSVDAFSVLVRANADFRDESNANEGLRKIVSNGRRIIEYLDDLGCQAEPETCGTAMHPYFPQMRNSRKTVLLTEKVIELIQEAYLIRSFPDGMLPKECRKTSEDAFANFYSKNIEYLDDEDELLDRKSFVVNSCISKILKLAERGNDVYFTKVREMVSYEINARFKRGDFGDDLEEILNLTRGDLVNSLLATYDQTQVNLAQLYDSLETSKDLSKKNLFFFSDYFRKAIKKVIKKADLKRDEKAKFCFRLIPMMKNDSLLDDVGDFCQGVSLNFYKNGPTLKWSDYVAAGGDKGIFNRGEGRSKNWHLVNKGTKHFVCGYHHYHRQNTLRDLQRTRKAEKELLNFLEYAQLP